MPAVHMLEYSSTLTRNEVLSQGTTRTDVGNTLRERRQASYGCVDRRGPEDANPQKQSSRGLSGAGVLAGGGWDGCTTLGTYYKALNCALSRASGTACELHLNNVDRGGRIGASVISNARTAATEAECLSPATNMPGSSRGTGMGMGERCRHTGV